MPRLITVLSALILTIVLLGTAFAQRAGQASSVLTGTVTGAQSVDLNDSNAIKGALVGGAFGAALTSSNKGSSRKKRNAAIGAVVGGARQSNKTAPGSLYTVTIADASTVQVATEQTEIRVGDGDCVYVEQSGSSANIRRAPDAACAPAAQEVMQDPAIQAEMQEEASECVAAKQELIDAETDEATDLSWLKQLHSFVQSAAPISQPMTCLKISYPCRSYA
jgi:outer membrane lipoprotein SlyB